MRAVVISDNATLSPDHEGTWCALSPLVDRPFLQHLVETIAGQGIREIDFILPEAEQAFIRLLGDGTRWGGRFRYHPVAADANVYDALQRIPFSDANERVLLAHSDRLPLLRLDGITSTATLFCWRAEQLYWTGWALIRAADTLLIPSGANEKSLFGFLLKSGTNAVCVEGARPLTARSYEDLIESNRRVLSREFPGLILGGREVRPGVWMARNVRVHPSARLTPPAFLGENSRIGALAQIGPAASIGMDCLIDRETHVVDSVVYSGSYVGPQLSLRGVVVDQSRLVSTRCNAEIDDVDDLLLGSVFGESIKSRAGRIGRQIAAAAALIVCLPCLAVMFLASSIGVIPQLSRRFVVRTPTVPESYRWRTFPLWRFGEEIAPLGWKGWMRHFFFDVLPALLPLAAGYVDLDGPRPRTSDEVEQLPAARRRAYLHSRSGILQYGSSEQAEVEAE